MNSSHTNQYKFQSYAVSSPSNRVKQYKVPNSIFNVHQIQKSNEFASKHQISENRKFEEDNEFQSDSDNLSGFTKFYLQCAICAEYFQSDQMVGITKCHHTFCSKCSLQYIKQCILNNKPILCPIRCGAQFDQRNKFLERLDHQLRQKYKKAQFIRYTNQHNLKICPHQKCQFGVLLEPQSYNRNILQCNSCSRKYCPKCLWPEHSGGCNEVIDKYIGIELLFAICSICKRKIERTQGCNHMVCICEYQFCYICLQQWEQNHSCPLINERKIRIQIKNSDQLRMTESMVQQQVQRQINQAIQAQQRRFQHLQYKRKQDQRLKGIELQRQILYEQVLREFQEKKKESMRRQQQERQQYEKRRVMERERGLQIMREYKAKKNGKWRADDDELSAILYNRTSNPQQNARQSIDEQQIKQSKKKSRILQSQQQAILRLKAQQEKKLNQTEARLMKIQMRMLYEKLQRNLQYEVNQERERRKLERVRKSNRLFTSSNNIL